MTVARNVGAFSVLLACAVLCRTLPALADPIPGKADEEIPEVHRPPFRFTDRPLTFDAVLGFGTPVGLLGVVVQYDVASALSLGGGVGTNIVGAQLAALLRVRPVVQERPERAIALEIGGAFATGPYAGQIGDLADLAGEGGHEAQDPNAQTYTLERVYWAQFEVGFEMKARSGFHLIAAGGVALPLNADAGSCRRVDTGQPVACDRRLVDRGDPWPTLSPVVTVMLGWSL